MVLPSEYEPFGVVVNEVMLYGCPVVVSDRAGGTRLRPDYLGAERVCVSRRLAGGNSKKNASAPGHLRVLGAVPGPDTINAVARTLAMACALKEDSIQENL
jgi:glycosyltransferase involved in cell wall biosynthesis